MAKVKHLTSEELAALRKAVREHFEEAKPHAAPLKANAYLPNYEALQTDMRYILKESHQLSVGRARLRKLFYYTDPHICEEKHLQQPRFGEDFLDACCFYISGNELSFSEWSAKKEERVLPKKAINNKYKRAAILLLLFFSAIMAAWVFQNGEKEKAWKETFDDTNLERLKKEGWEILFHDSILWKKQLREGYLTTYATPGGLWITEPDSYASIDNFLIKKINEDCFSLEIKIVDFEPTYVGHQVGIILLEENKELLPWVKFIVGRFNEPRPPQKKLGLSFMGRQKGKIEKMEQLFSLYSDLHTPTLIPNDEPIDTIWLRIDVDDDEFCSYVKVNNPDREYFREIINPKEFLNLSKPLDLKYVGLGAFGGGSKKYPLLYMDTIPCFVDEISFTPCDVK